MNSSWQQQRSLCSSVATLIVAVSELTYQCGGGGGGASGGRGMVHASNYYVEGMA